MKELVTRFVNSFQKAVRVEMDAMREQLGPFEVEVAEARRLETPEDSPYEEYAFVGLAPNDKLVLNGECTLVHDGGEALVTIVELDGNAITLRCANTIRMDSSAYVLVIYPWFLYERLLLVLESLPDSEAFCATNALALFGKLKPRRRRTLSEGDGADLNASQQHAIQLCKESSVAFVWGPPGTGKTTTLGHIVTGLLEQGHRVLVTSTTNAAVDQALAKLVALPAAHDYLSNGQIVRVGQTDADTFGASLNDIVRSQNKDVRVALAAMTARRDKARIRISNCDALLTMLQTAGQMHQLDMFAESDRPVIALVDLETVFAPVLAVTILRLPSETQQARIAARKLRLQKVKDLCQERVAQSVQRSHDRAATVIEDARVILATMTTMYISQILLNERFDVVIIEEAGMAILPTLFYCAGLGSKKAIAIGDPRQLPPIVRSRDSYVHQAMGRNIFEVTVPEPHTSEVVVMLDTQYRMHPIIGSLVADLFYDGRLLNADSTLERNSIAGKAPYPGQPLTVIDTGGSTTCTTAEGSYSRMNEQTAAICVSLAAEAIDDGMESIAIVTPYVQQSRLIQKQLRAAHISGDRVECRTVHRFQGNERDMVIFDTVDTHPMKPGVLLAGRKGRTSAPNLINVSISRAKGKLVIISDVSYFHLNAPGSAIDRLLTAATAAGTACCDRH
ncbi:MAG: AAA family ATPase [Verrucomicrobia bacterium]|jgi:hypothetical protein|nr:AAA family ATPase [Verrucomicrobiota bacterium]MBT7067864.1 AAA family ATPase [Verrucomicrobiota bacterium]MBT7699867.1 AAA family ATPase [Verrucomicrobiota bacterium]